MAWLVLSELTQRLIKDGVIVTWLPESSKQVLSHMMNIHHVDEIGWDMTLKTSEELYSELMQGTRTVIYLMLRTIIAGSYTQLLFYD